MEEDMIVIRMKSTENLHKSFKEGKAPINICKAPIELFRDDVMTVVVLLPGITVVGGYKVKEVAVIHEVGEDGSSRVVKNTTPLVTRE